MATTKLSDCMPSQLFAPERVRYFPRMLMTPDDMIAEQEYFRHKIRRHNRYLHGWGVVCGCEVKADIEATEDAAFKVKVLPGYILGPFGDEIIIWKELSFDIRSELICACKPAEGNGSVEIDPWCKTGKEPFPRNATYYIAVRYHELETRQVRSHPTGCTCGENHCEATRYLDCFAVKALTELPASHTGTPPREPDFLRTGEDRRLPACPPCPSEPWVVLASVVPQDANNEQVINNCRHRRLVASLGNFWWRCQETPTATVTEDLPPAQAASLAGLRGAPDSPTAAPPAQAVITSMKPVKLDAGSEPVVTIRGQNFVDGLTLDFGAAVKSKIGLKEIISVKTSEIKARVKVWANARSGERDITITNPGSTPVSGSVDLQIKTQDA